jgi:hypothetical protein
MKGVLTPFFCFILFHFQIKFLHLQVLKIFLYSIFLLPFVVFAQQNVLFLKQDTLNISTRTGGNTLDSVDWYHSGSFSLNPGGPLNNPFGNSGSNYLNVSTIFQSQLHLPKKLKSTFTALPHLGFAYSFGSGSLQYLNAEYQQSFKKNTHLNIVYNRSSITAGKGFMRNNSFANDAFQFLVDHQGKRYRNLIYFDFIKADRALNGGIRTDTLIALYGLDFTPVYKENARSINRNLQFGSQHLFALNNDSLVQHGLVYKNKWSIQNRILTEVDTIYGIYNQLNIDSTETRDQFQLARITNAGGYYLNTSKFKVEALIQHGYWRFQNLGVNRDTNEIELQGNLSFDLGKLQFQNDFSLNLAGALGEWSEKATASIKTEKIQQYFSFSVQSSLPSPFVRQYYANNHNWKLNPIETQGKTAFDYEAHLPKWANSSICLGFINLKNNYFYFDSVWRNDTLNSINLLSLNLRSHLKWKVFHWQPQVILNSSTANFGFLPQFDLRSKLFFNKRLFKAKKLDFILGVDLRYQANYKMLNYDVTLDLYRLPAQKVNHEAMFELDFFTGIQIDEFRFYFKFENIDYFWNKQTNLQQIGYPISPNLIRLGFTWDFFN